MSITTSYTQSFSITPSYTQTLSITWSYTQRLKKLLFGVSFSWGIGTYWLLSCYKSSFTQRWFETFLPFTTFFANVQGETTRFSEFFSPQTVFLNVHLLFFTGTKVRNSFLLSKVFMLLNFACFFAKRNLVH